jgi:hypothetical protein
MEQIQTHINQLYQLDKKEAELKASLKVVSDEVRSIKQTLLNEIKDHQLEKRPFIIGDKIIKYKIIKDTEGLSQKYLKQVLNKYFEDTPTEAKNLFDFIISSRNSKYVELVDLSARPNPKTQGKA